MSDVLQSRERRGTCVAQPTCLMNVLGYVNHNRLMKHMMARPLLIQTYAAMQYYTPPDPRGKTCVLD